MRVHLLFVGLIFALIGCASHPSKSDAPPAPVTKNPPLPHSLEEAVHSEFRTPANTARDIYRHPMETLKFFGLKPDMTVIEISPSAGWYTEILAPYLAEKGRYIAADAHGAGGSAEHQAQNAQFSAWMQKFPQVATVMGMTEFQPPDHLAISPPNSADMILTFRNLHNWLQKNSEKAVFAAFYKALKPGGILGLVDHRARHDLATEGYVEEKQAIRLAEKAGFKLVARSEINANPKDTKDYPKGVWTLPPSYALGDQDHDKYTAIGESDRMTLKFQKPMKK